jgi:glucokinase
MPSRLQGLENFNWSQYLGIETYVLNDAHSHLVAESKIGVGVGYKNIVLLTLGTGVGGGILINGRLYQGEIGRAGHLGHTSLNQKENTSIAGTPGSLEESIGEYSLEARSFGKFHSTKDLVKAYKNGDTFATWVWLRSVEHLARGMVSTINAFSPQLFILTGGISRAGDALLEPLKSFLDVYEWRPGGFSVDIKLASEGSRYTGALGAALFSIIRKEEQ